MTKPTVMQADIDRADEYALSVVNDVGPTLAETLAAHREAAINEIRSNIIPRRPLDDHAPDGYMESDTDFVLNNLAACLEWLEPINPQQGGSTDE